MNFYPDVDTDWYSPTDSVEYIIQRYTTRYQSNKTTAPDDLEGYPRSANL